MIIIFYLSEIYCITVWIYFTTHWSLEWRLGLFIWVLVYPDQDTTVLNVYNPLSISRNLLFIHFWKDDMFSELLYFDVFIVAKIEWYFRMIFQTWKHDGEIWIYDHNSFPSLKSQGKSCPFDCQFSFHNWYWNQGSVCPWTIIG